MSKKPYSRPSPFLPYRSLLSVGFLVFVVLAVPFAIRFPHRFRCANTGSCEASLAFRVDNSSAGIFQNQAVTVPPVHVSDELTDIRVNGLATASGEKHIYVDLTKQMLYAYEGQHLFIETPISSGKWNRTPTGEFTIWHKVRSTRMSGGSGADYYDLPNVPYNMFFYNKDVSKGQGFALHGAYWHNNFGHQMSHGCVNMRPIDAEKLYYWASPVTSDRAVSATEDNPGTSITIYFSSAPTAQ